MTTPARRSAEEAGRLGDAIYNKRIRQMVEGTHHGKVVAIDLDTGEHAIGDTVLAATEPLLAQRPDADTWCVRVGYRTLRNFGGRPLRGSQ